MWIDHPACLIYVHLRYETMVLTIETFALADNRTWIVNQVRLRRQTRSQVVASGMRLSAGSSALHGVGIQCPGAAVPVARRMCGCRHTAPSTEYSPGLAWTKSAHRWNIPCCHSLRRTLRFSTHDE